MAAAHLAARRALARPSVGYLSPGPSPPPTLAPPLPSAQSIYQDDDETKGKGVVSLIKYATLCKYMLVPLDQRNGELPMYPDEIKDYGERGWW